MNLSLIFADFITKRAAKLVIPSTFFKSCKRVCWTGFYHHHQNRAICSKTYPNHFSFSSEPRPALRFYFRFDDLSKLENMPALLSKEEFYVHFDSVKQLTINFLSSRLNFSQQACKEWIESVFDYNVPHGKLYRGLTLVHAYQQLNDNIEDNELTIVCQLGWAIELLQSSFLVADDIMDGSITRRGRLCWYKQPDIGFNAVNDSLLMENCVDLIMHRLLRDKPYFANVQDVFREAKLMTICGQHMDSQPFNIDVCTRERYADIVRCKTSFYTFLLPIMTALKMSEDVFADELQIRELSYKLGFYFQAQDDYLDCFGDAEITGKIGTDIQDGKCTWLLVEALEEIRTTKNNDKIKIIKENYQKTDPKNVETIKNLYESLNLKEKYERFEYDQVASIEKQIEQLSLTRLQPLFKNMLAMLHRRQK